MTPKRFTFKVADRMGYTGEPSEYKATILTAEDLGWYSCGAATLACPVWFPNYLDLINWRMANERQVEHHQAMVAKCSEMIEKLYEDHA